MKRFDFRLWLARLLIATVIAWNVQAAVFFLVNPSAGAADFELSGVSGATVMTGVAILFLMWNVPYVVAFWHPRHHRLSLWEALTMQGVGLLGEVFILLSQPLISHAQLVDSILRFITFDAIGLVALGAALILTKIPRERLAKPVG